MAHCKSVQVTALEAAIHAMNQVFNEEGADGVLLIDATKAFNQMNRARIEAHQGCSLVAEARSLPKRVLPKVISSLRASIPQVKQVWLANDSAGGGSIESLYQWYKSLCEEGKKFGYIVNGAKSWLIVKNSSKT